MLSIILAVIPSLSHAAKTHKVKKTETLNSLARKYHVSVADLKSANNLVSAQVKKGDTLIIPPRNLQADTADSKPENSLTYKVKRGDTIARIAKKTGVSVADIKRLNHLGKKSLKLGQVIALRAEEPAKEEAPKVARRYSLRYSELLSEKDYEQSLSDLTDSDPGRPSEIQKPVAEAQTDNAKQLKHAAYGFLGTRYRFGGNTRSGLDCSAFVQKVFRELEVSLPRSAREQFEVGNEVPFGDLKKGDLVFFRTYARYPSHVGIYLGNNRMIHASSRDRRVVISSLNSSYYRSRYLGAKRISKINPELFRFDDLLTGIEEEPVDDANKNDTLDTLGVSLNN
ncbi:NlpC/P60 family protein [Geobacter sp. OR-1]|uniref:NlpC/P60 family protein n=1 Tax=Geobacter sp. OR-1 TaxID=1266765 RepID=UPI00351C220D